MVKSHTLSTFLFLFFVLFTFTVALYTDFYQAPKIGQSTIEETQLVFKEGDFENIVEMRFKNRLGDFLLNRPGSESFEWQLTKPRMFPASSAPIRTILGQLYKLKIRKIYEFEPINTYNFSLDSPVLELDLKNQDGKTWAIRFGLSNSIDNSTYISVNTKNAIFHIDGISENLETMDLAKFIESKVAPYLPERVQSIAFYRALKSDSNLILKAVQKGNKEWSDSAGNPLQEDLVNELLKDFLSIKAQAILDVIPESAQANITKAKTTPQWTMEVELAGGTVVEYAISDLMEKPMPELKIDKRSHFLISAKHLQYPYLVAKDYFKIWEQLSAQRLKKLPIKKLFY
ncbi:MAG: hypothetical protein A2X86_01240 [Bdellovibrionales bacterium GWA2_49_15]|nr:MAG: hypothetical protein A2X86_01240 [Bdellovibrionales bacterium GWA2_49_15]HAZ12151.1 hypothetical protein [Bdellovibrionales bacterium]